MHILDQCDFDLPESLIARHPKKNRSSSRLLCVNRQEKTWTDDTFASILDRLRPTDCLVINNTKVLQARLFGEKPAGGKIEALITTLSTDDPQQAQALLKSNHYPKQRFTITFPQGYQAVAKRGDHDWHLTFNAPVTTVMEAIGNMPIPQYFKRDSTAEDSIYYQTTYAKHLGSIAAPTAGLHFTQELLQALADKGVDIITITLHVGYGTFQPLTETHFNNKALHSETLQISPEAAEKINWHRAQKHRIIAVGSTSMRALESAIDTSGAIQPLNSSTCLFIEPGYTFRAVDALITNFHLPRSSLILLIGAFIGSLEFTRSLYQHAIATSYLFYSYGDAMLIE